MTSRPSTTVAELVTKLTKHTPAEKTFGGVVILELVDYPEPGQTTFVTDGLAAHDRSVSRGKPTGFELVLTTRVLRDPLCERLAEVVRDDLAAHKYSDSQARGSTLPPRGVMYNGVFACVTAPHLVFSTDIVLAPALTERHRCGEHHVEFLPTIPITADELETFDVMPRSFIARLRARTDLDDITARLGRKRRPVTQIDR